jgi:hypothetical protein
VKHYSWPLATTIRFRRNDIRKWTPSLVDAFTWEFKVALTGKRSFCFGAGGKPLLSGESMMEHACSIVKARILFFRGKSRDW